MARETTAVTFDKPWRRRAGVRVRRPDGEAGCLPAVTRITQT
jgi:hypothetical protein